MWVMICGTLCDACFSFLLARESAKGEEVYAWKRMDMCHDQCKDGRTTSLCLDMLLSLPLAGWLVSWFVNRELCERVSK